MQRSSRARGMSFCPRCGSPTTAAMAFCTKCGETLTPGAAQGGAPAPGHAHAPPMAHAPAAQHAVPPAWGVGPAPVGPMGSTREPWLVVLLVIVTLGIYSLVYWWRLSKEMDVHMGTPDRAHKLIKWGVLLSIIAMVVGLITFISFFGAIAAIESSGGLEPGLAADETAAMGVVFGMLGAFLLVGALALGGSVLLYIGKYRVWEALEGQERRLGRGDALSAGLMLALSIAAYFVPFVGWMLPLVVVYMTQDHLNRIWAPQPVYGFTSPS